MFSTSGSLTRLQEKSCTKIKTVDYSRKNRDVNVIHGAEFKALLSTCRCQNKLVALAFPEYLIIWYLTRSFTCHFLYIESDASCYSQNTFVLLAIVRGFSTKNCWQKSCYLLSSCWKRMYCNVDFMVLF